MNSTGKPSSQPTAMDVYLYLVWIGVRFTRKEDGGIQIHAPSSLLIHEDRELLSLHRSALNQIIYRYYFGQQHIDLAVPVGTD